LRGRKVGGRGGRQGLKPEGQSAGGQEQESLQREDKNEKPSAQPGREMSSEMSYEASLIKVSHSQ